MILNPTMGIGLLYANFMINELGNKAGLFLKLLFTEVIRLVSLSLSEFVLSI